MAKFLKTMTTLSFCLAVFGPEGAEANYSVSTKLGESAVYSEDSWWRGMFGSIQYKKLVEMVRGSRIEYEPAFGLNDGIDAVFKNTGEIDPSYYYKFDKDGSKRTFQRIAPGHGAFRETGSSDSPNDGSVYDITSDSFKLCAMQENSGIFEVDADKFYRVANGLSIHVVETFQRIAPGHNAFWKVETVDGADVHIGSSADDTNDPDLSSSSGKVFYTDEDSNQNVMPAIYDISRDTPVVIRRCTHIITHVNNCVFQVNDDTFYRVSPNGCAVETFSAVALLNGLRVFERRRRSGIFVTYMYRSPVGGIDTKAYFNYSDGTFTAKFERFGKTFFLGKDRITLYVVKDATYPTEVDTYSLTEVPTSQQNGLNHNGLRSKYVNKEGIFYFSSPAERA